MNTPAAASAEEQVKDALDPPASRSIECLAQIIESVVASQVELGRLLERTLRRDLRWKAIRAVIFGVTFVVAAAFYCVGLEKLLVPPKSASPYAALVRIEGLIDADQKANASKVNASLRAAFADPQARGVLIVINSPGGSPVQASLIHDRLLSLRAQHPGRPVWVIGEDMLTSGAYYIAVAGDRLCVNRSTMTGSIGVVMSGWGLSRAIDRYGVERRVFTAGQNKARLDAFRPLTADDERKANALVRSIHAQFIAAVQAARGTRLKGNPKLLWSGDYWTGEEAVSLGLVDGLCDLNSVMEGELRVSQVRDYTAPAGLWSTFASSFGITAQQLIATEISGFQPRLLPQ